MKPKLTTQVISSLASYQIHALVRKGIEVDALKSEWFKRWKLDYPLMKYGNGEIKTDNDF